jgi:hypothetical protein
MVVLTDCTSPSAQLCPVVCVLWLMQAKAKAEAEAKAKAEAEVGLDYTT